MKNTFHLTVCVMFGTFFLWEGPAYSQPDYIRTEIALIDGVTTENELANLPHTKKSVHFTYFDGLARTLQEVSVAQSPEGFDLVKPVAYDDRGRPYRDYLHYIETTSDGRYHNDAETQVINYYTNQKNDTRPFTEISFENSPFNHPEIQIGPGAVWYANDKVARQEFRSNGSEQVLKFDIGGSNLNVQSWWPAAALKGVERTDENGVKVLEFHNLEGELLVKRIQANADGTAWADTYYVYDLMGNLRYVLPPEGISAIQQTVTGLSGPIDAEVLEQWAFQYRYDGRRRLVEKSVPGSDWVYFVYDHRDRLVLSQDGNQRDVNFTSGNEWTFTKYDAYNRVVSSGTYQHTGRVSRNDMQLLVDDFYRNVSPSTMDEEFTGDSEHHGYSNRAFPKEIQKEDYNAIYYYDHYSFRDQLPGFGAPFAYDAPPFGCHTTVRGTYCYEASPNEGVRGQLTGQKLRILERDAWLSMVNYYDGLYRPIQTIAANEHRDTKERLSNLYNFRGWLLEDYKELDYPGHLLGVRQSYTYDHGGRLLRGHHEVYENNVGQGKELLAENRYNELGELIEKNLSKDKDMPVQSIDFRYNIRGWLQSINSPSLLHDAAINHDEGQPKDLFGMELYYQTPIPGLN